MRNQMKEAQAKCGNQKRRNEIEHKAVHGGVVEKPVNEIDHDKTKAPKPVVCVAVPCAFTI